MIETNELKGKISSDNKIQGGNTVISGPQGKEGLSAYEVAVKNGYIGSEEEWLKTLKGEKGDQGEQGIQGDVSLKQLNELQTKTIKCLQEVETPTPVSGTSIDLNDSADAKITELKISGNSKQETNLYNGKLVQGSINAEGISSATDRVSTENEIEVIENTQTKVNANGADQFIFAIYDSSKNYMGTSGTWTDLGNSITIPANIKYIRVILRKSDNSNITPSDISNFIVGDTPSPDYPSEVECCGDNINIFDISKYDYRNLSDASVQITDNTNFRITSKVSTSSNCAVGFKITDLTKYAGKTLTIQAFAKSNTNTNKAFLVLRQNNSDYTGTKTNELYDETQNTTNGVITLKYKVADTITDSNRYLFIWFYATRGVTCNVGDYVDYKVKLEEGSTATPYSKNGQGCINEVICNKNLFDKFTTTDGKYIDNAGGIQTQSETMHSDYITIKTNIDYYISGRNNWSSIALYDKNKIFLERISAGVNGVLNITNSNCKYIKINALLTDKNTLLLEEGSTATPYEEHKSQTYTIPTQQPFRSNGDIRDTFIKKNNKWYEHHSIIRKIFDGTEHIILHSINNCMFKISNVNGMKNINGKEKAGILCTNFKENYQSTLYNDSSLVGIGGVGGDVNALYLQFGSKSSINTVDLFKTWLSSQYNAGTPVYVDYVLKTPIDIECTEEQSTILWDIEQNAKTYKNITHMYSTDNVSPNVEVTYKKDIETLFENTLVEGVG